MNHELSSTICASATAPGGALAVVRVSGPDALAIVSSLCSVHCDNVAVNTVHFTRITDGTDIIDEVLVTVFRAPHSYTGEDSIEISCHGSSYILNRVLALLIEKGCRMARPGEFTMRAYLNGKMDLSQAEAVADLIASSNKATHDIAMRQLRGHFSSELDRLREQLLKLTSLLELELDFSDHEDLEFADRAELLSLAQEIDSRVMNLARSFEAGQALKRGIPVAIVGKTNVGKSTLLNQLVGDERAIVSDIHGTTRDTIEETMEIDGVQFRFIDTAGLRQTSDRVEQIGIERTNTAIQKARIVLWLFDQKPSEEEVNDMLGRCELSALIPVLNKVDGADDAGSFWTFCPSVPPALKISAKHGRAVSRLKRSIFDQARKLGLIANSSDLVVTNARHYDALLRAHDSIQRVVSGLDLQLSGDLLSEDLRHALDILAEITGGKITPQETLNNIFSHFCVGK